MTDSFLWRHYAERMTDHQRGQLMVEELNAPNDSEERQRFEADLVERARRFVEDNENADAVGANVPLPPGETEPQPFEATLFGWSRRFNHDVFWTEQKTDRFGQPESAKLFVTTDQELSGAYYYGIHIEAHLTLMLEQARLLGARLIDAADELESRMDHDG